MFYKQRKMVSARKQSLNPKVVLVFSGSLLLTLALIVQGIASQHTQQQRQKQSWINGQVPPGLYESQAPASIDGGEQVDKLSSATGDLIWRSMPEQQQEQQQADWLKQIEGQGYYSPMAAGFEGGLPQMRNYHALVDEFKQFSPLANPMREGRAFKPKLMSTARGFGKRSFQAPEYGARPHISYSDLLAAANQNIVNANGKMSGNALR